mmetsp:Transcript_34458/g.52728  ORF Transcript_34458/g.52728 Transcript_34458/m.52728 type:complete len:204 (+) Transcript_34458:2483-3094(+)
MRHGIGVWTQQHVNEPVVLQEGTTINKKLVKESFTGKFQNNHFEGYGLYTVTYEVQPLSMSMNLTHEAVLGTNRNSDINSLPGSPGLEPKKETTCDVYEGEWRNSLKHGSGTEKYSNGDMYVGHFRQGEPDGTGKYIWKNGSIYTGAFRDGKKHGKGQWKVIDVKKTATSTKVRSSVYNGDFEDDSKSGFGTMIWSTGGRYDG